MPTERNPPSINGHSQRQSTTTERSPTADGDRLAVGVVGVGAMGENHARVYADIDDVDLVGVADVDDERATAVADRYDTVAVSPDSLREACDAVTVAVPTGFHHEVVGRFLDDGVHVLVEKPIADSIADAQDLARRAAASGVVLQVGHVERFNPAVSTAADVLSDANADVIAVQAERLGPPVDRTAIDDVVLDLMIHDVDVVNSLLEGNPRPVGAAGTEDGQYATATVRFDDVVASFTASRVTQKKVRRLRVTTRECLLDVDYLDQSVVIHRKSSPSYVTDDGPSRYRNETVIERPRVDNGEPLRVELEAFIEAIETGTEPPVTAAEGIEALALVDRIERMAAPSARDSGHQRRSEYTGESVGDHSDGTRRINANSGSKTRRIAARPVVRSRRPMAIATSEVREVKTEAEAVGEVVPTTERESEVKPEANTEAVVGNEAVTERVADSESDDEAGTEVETEPEPEAETEPDAETDTELEAETDANGKTRHRPQRTNDGTRCRTQRSNRGVRFR